MAVQRARGVRWAQLACVVLALAGVPMFGCDRSGTRAAPTKAAEREPAPAAASAAPSPAGSVGTFGAGSGLGALRGGSPCEPNTASASSCRRFDDAAAALQAILELRPQVIAFGEAHARRDAPHVPTATERFERELLPVVAAAGARQLVVELLRPAADCERPVAAVKQVQKPVVEAQDEQNQNRFVSLGHAAKARGVTPFLLEPSCDEYQSIARAGDDGVLRMLELIASKTTRLLLKMRGAQAEPALLVAYGGAMHNDVVAGDDVGAGELGSEYTFGAEMLRATRGRYAAVDLIVPEYIAPTPVWQRLSWYDDYQRLGPSGGVTLFRTDPHSFALIFPAGESAGSRAQPQ